MNKLLAVAKKLKENTIELYALALLTIGLPLVGFLYVDLRLAIGISIVVQTVIATLAIKKQQ